MDSSMENVVWFKDVNKNDGAMVGGKGANLGEMYGAGIPVPNGFIITSGAYFETIQKSGTMDRLRSILFNIDVENPQLLEDKAKACRQEILKLALDPKLEKDIISHYKKLSGKKDVYVAVRSSATAEDLPGASFAGQQATFLNIRGEKNLIPAVLGAWASLFEARAIFYRVQKNFDHFQVGIAVPVQKMVQSQLSGVMFTIDPITNNKDTVVIEAIYGLGEYIVSGEVTPDHYEVSKSKNKIITKTIVTQTKQLVRSKEGNKPLAVSGPYQKLQKLDDGQILKLTKIGEKIEKHYYFPQDIEWAAEDDTLYIVQTRPVTTIKSSKIDKNETEKSNVLDKSLDVLVQGAPASPAINSGPVVVIHSPKELSRVKKGDVLVTEMTNPDYVPAMKRAVGVVTDRGGRTSHAAIVSRELGIACVVGTGKATSVLKDGMIVTVDGARGIVYRGEMAINKKDVQLKREITKSQSSRKTATKLYVNLAEPSLAPKIAGQNVDGVGLLRAEFMLAEIGVHPKQFILEGRQDKFVDRLSSDLSIFGRSFGKRNVIYRASDFKSNEYSNLKGGDKFEPKESNPMLGYRGAFRYIKDPDVFKLELEALIRTRKKHKNVQLMIPFVRSVEELKAVRLMVEEVGLFKDPSFKFWMMVEIPVNVVMLEDFIKVGIDGVSIGSNDLTMLILGTDRDNEEVATEFNELNPAVLWALERIVKTSHRYGVTCSICGQAPSIYPQLTDLLVKWGITSISVNPDVIDSTREIIYQAEEKLLKK
jgi:pyruvate,water dikinase